MVTLVGDLASNLAQARTAPRESRSCRPIGGKGSIEAIGNAILLGVGARNRPTAGISIAERTAHLVDVRLGGRQNGVNASRLRIGHRTN
jgi:hypothetical protein